MAGDHRGVSRGKRLSDTSNALVRARAALAASHRPTARAATTPAASVAGRTVEADNSVMDHLLWVLTRIESGAVEGEDVERSGDGRSSRPGDATEPTITWPVRGRS